MGTDTKSLWRRGAVTSMWGDKTIFLMSWSVFLLGDWGLASVAVLSTSATENSVFGFSTVISGVLTAVNSIAKQPMALRPVFISWLESFCSVVVPSAFVTPLSFSAPSEIPESSPLSSALACWFVSLVDESMAVSIVDEKSMETSFCSRGGSSSSNAKFSCDLEDSEANGTTSLVSCVSFTVSSASSLDTSFSLSFLSKIFGKVLTMKIAILGKFSASSLVCPGKHKFQFWNCCENYALIFYQPTQRVWVRSCKCEVLWSPRCIFDWRGLMILSQYVPAFVSECYVFVIFDCVLGMLNTIVALTLTLKTQKVNKK